MLVGYDERYTDYVLSRIPSIEIVVFNRFGTTQDRGALVFDAGTPRAMAKVLAVHRGACS